MTYKPFSIFIDQSKVLNFEIFLSDGLLFLKLTVNFDHDLHQCSCSGTLTIKQSNRTEKHLIEKFILSKGQGYFIGAWDKIFEKKEMVCNLAKWIPLNKFQDLKNQTILDFLTFNNGVIISSFNIKKTIVNL